MLMRLSDLLHNFAYKKNSKTILYAGNRKISQFVKDMVNNYQAFGGIWKKIELGKQAFILMKRLSPTLEGEFNTPADKAFLLSQMLE